MEIIVVANQKGGVGKSTTTECIGANLIERGKKVLFIDLDPQGNLTSSFPIEIEDPCSAFELLRGDCSLDDAIQNTNRGDIIPASKYLSNKELIFADRQVGREKRLKDILSKQKLPYDYIMIDTPPSLDILTINALAVANKVLVPAQADVYSLQGIALLIQTIQDVKEDRNKKLKLSGFVLVRFNPRTVISKNIFSMLEEIAKSQKTTLFKTHIRECTAIKEAQALKESIFTYSPKSNIAKDYAALVDELLEKEA